jgi:hypothetical protein
MDYLTDIDRLSLTHPDLAAELRDLRGLGGVMALMRGRGLNLGEVEIVQQDEFSLDFLIPLPGAGCLAFGIT